MRLQLAILFALALTAQLVNAAWHGFDPVEDGLQLVSAATLSLLILRLNRVRSQRRKELILQVLDELGQPDRLPGVHFDAVGRNTELAQRPYRRAPSGMRTDAMHHAQTRRDDPPQRVAATR